MGFLLWMSNHMDYFIQNSAGGGLSFFNVHNKMIIVYSDVFLAHKITYWLIGPKWRLYGL